MKGICLHTYTYIYVRTYVHTYIHTYIHTFRSTIEFAREVSEAKAMEDTLKGIENLGGGGGGGTGDVLVAKAGSVGHKHIHDTMVCCCDVM